MKKLTHKYKIFITFLALLFLAGCYEFDFINQPHQADPNSSFDVQINVLRNTEFDYPVYYGVMLPEGWSIADSVLYTGVTANDTGFIVYSDSLTLEMNLVDSPCENYYWWVGKNPVSEYLDTNYIANLKIYTDSQTGTFFLDYMLGDSYNGLNQKRSNDHIIIVGEPIGCLAEGINFSTQEEIDNFQLNYPGCTSIAGGVTISGENIINIIGLDSLTSIGGNLFVEDNDNLTSLLGLENLTYIGGALSFSENYMLESLSGLNNLSSIGRGLSIGTMYTSNMAGLENLTSIGRGLTIEDNNSLLNLNGLENLTDIGGNLNLSNCNGIINLSGLDNLTSIGGSFELIGNESLINLYGLGNLTSLTNGLFIFGNTSLINLSGLNFSPLNLEGDIQIVTNDVLTSLSGLENINSVEGDLIVCYNEMLISFSGLNDLNYIGQEMMIYANNSLSNFSGLENLSVVGKNVTIGRKIGPPWSYVGNPVLTSLSGLDNLNSIGGDLQIAFNDMLVDIMALENLESVLGDITINSNDELLNLSGFESIISIEGNLDIRNSVSLISLSGLNNVTSIGKGLYVINNDALINLTGFDNLTSVTDSLDIGHNDALINLSGLEGVFSVGGTLKVYLNSALTSLLGLENIDAGTISKLSIAYNSELSTCHVQSICDYLAAPTGTIDIQNNAPGCNSEEEVLDACENNCLPEGITFTTQAEIDSFQVNYPGCTEIDGDVEIGSYPGSNITNLSGLGALTSIGGNLEIAYNNILINLMGLNNLNSVEGSLWIYGNDTLNNLSGLEYLSSIGGSLGIGKYLGNYVYMGNPALNNIESLINLTYIGEGIQIYNNDNLANLSGLNNMSTLDGGLVVLANSALSDLSGLDNLTSFGMGGNGVGLTVMSNISLMNINGLNNVTSIDGVVLIYNNNSLTSLYGLNNLGAINGILSITGNDVLTNLSGLENVTSIGGTLRIKNNNSITSLTGLGNLNSITGDLIIGGEVGNSSLTSLSGLDNLAAGTIENIEIQNNILLSECDVQSICDYLVAPNGTVEIHDNAPGCNNQLEVEEVCASCIPDSIFFSSQAQIDSFQFNHPYCTEIEGDVYIGSYPSSDITNLEGLNVLNSIGGNLSVGFGCGLQSGGGSNHYLESLAGLNNLTSIGEHLGIERCGALTSLAGLDNLTSVGGSLGIGCNSALTSLAGLEGLTSFGGSVTIRYNDALTNLTGLEFLTSIESLFVILNDSITSLAGLENLNSISGSLTVRGNEVLANLSGLENLSFIGVNLRIGGTSYGTSNPLLGSLAGLTNVTSIGGYLFIAGNDVLTSLIGLENIDAGSISDLSIVDNSGLSTCEVQSICNYLAAPNGTIEIENNATGCNTQQEVEEDCEKQCLYGGIIFTTQTEIDSFKINYPNCTEIEGSVEISGIDIINIDSLIIITSIGGCLNIHDNPSLTSLSGLDSINPETIDSLFIYDNNSLSDCDIMSICQYLSTLNGYNEIYNNASGCNNQEEVDLACLTNVLEIGYDIHFDISPNPLESSSLIKYTIQYKSPVTINIYDLTGQEIKTLVNEKQQQGKQQVIFNTGDLPAGVYFCVLKTNQGMQTKKIIKL